MHLGGISMHRLVDGLLIATSCLVLLACVLIRTPSHNPMFQEVQAKAQRVALHQRMLETAVDDMANEVADLFREVDALEGSLAPLTAGNRGTIDSLESALRDALADMKHDVQLKVAAALADVDAERQKHLSP